MDDRRPILKRRRNINFLDSKPLHDRSSAPLSINYLLRLTPSKLFIIFTIYAWSVSFPTTQNPITHIVLRSNNLHDLALYQRLANICEYRISDCFFVFLHVVSQNHGDECVEEGNKHRSSSSNSSIVPFAIRTAMSSCFGRNH
jgi:hypothetical protein